MGVPWAVSKRAAHPPRRAPNRSRAVVYAVIVHVVLLALIVIGVRWQSRPPVPANVIQAKTVSDVPPKKEREGAEQEAKKKRDQQERERQAADDKRRAAEQAKAAELKRQADAKRKAADADKKRKAQQQADLKRKQDAEERKAAEQSLKEQLASEEQERTAAKARAEQAAHAQSELTRYEGLIRQKVERNWVRPVGWTKGTECTVRVRLAPTGEVIQATVTRPSGNSPFDRSVENAVYKASPLPMPEDPGLFDHFREFELRFRPEGLT